MYRKKWLFFVTIILFLSGCTKITSNLDDVIKATMTSDRLKANTVSTGYELYIPIGVNQVFDSEYNQCFKVKNRYIYLYVDTISYYYKNILNYKKNSDYSYYYRELSLDGKTGYIGINEVDDNLYFCEIVYNYSKSEFYADKDELPIVMANALMMQKSIKFNDNLISVELESGISEGKDIKYELDSPKDTESTFSDYLQEYVPEEEPEVELPDDIG